MRLRRPGPLPGPALGPACAGGATPGLAAVTHGVTPGKASAGPGARGAGAVVRLFVFSCDAVRSPLSRLRAAVATRLNASCRGDGAVPAALLEGVFPDTRSCAAPSPCPQRAQHPGRAGRG